tara:strand:- start:8403 stop:8750 length:348 start_codon:yes stop_codon:yes gene_type:complete
MLTRSNVKPDTMFYSLEISKEEYDFMSKRYENILKWYPTRNVQRDKKNIIKRMCLEKRVFDEIVDDTIVMLKSKEKEKEYVVDIDFDGASKVWKKNKIKISDGMYRYKRNKRVNA